jgi:hypothetical protein
MTSLDALGTRPISKRILDGNNQNHDYSLITTDVVTSEQLVQRVRQDAGLEVEAKRNMILSSFSVSRKN